MSEKNFRFWVPLDKLEKGDAKDGKPATMKVGGIASTKRKDMDGESLDPNGFDLSYFKNKGIVNWNHNKSPDAVIGEPTSATVTKEGLYVEAELYCDNPLAKSVYALAETLQKSSKTRRLGFSIEGKATERDEADPTNVSKALITNIALTISPKNPDSIVDIIKGEFNELSEDQLKPYDYAFDAEFEVEKLDKIEKAVEADLEKGMEAGYDGGSTSVNQPNSGGSLQKESVEGKTKKQTDKDEDDDDKDDDKTKNLTKSEAVDELMKTSSVITLEKANQIVETLINLEMAKDDKKVISSETIEKALGVLGLGKEPSADNNDLNKGNEDDLNKGADAAASAASKDDDSDDDEDDDDDKSDEFKKLKKSFDLMASERIENDRAIGTLLKGIYEGVMDTKAEVEGLRSENVELRKALDDSLGQPAGQRKTTTTKVAERNFEKGLNDEADDTLEKGNANIMSISNNKPQVLALLDKMTFEKGFNAEIAKAMTTFESGNVLEKGIQDLIKSEYNITLVQ